MNPKDIFKYVLISGLLATLFIPFAVADTQLFPYITGKAFTFRILAEILFGIWLVAMVWDASLRPKFSLLLGSVFAFAGIVLIADLAGMSFYKSFWSNFERMDGFITLIHMFAYFLVGSSVLNTIGRWKIFFNTSVVASAIMAIYVFMQLAGKIQINQGGVRVDGTLGNATYLAVYMLFNIFITLFLLLRSYQTHNRMSVALGLWYGAAILMQTIVLYYTATRGAILGLIGGLIVFGLIIAIFERSRPILRKSAIGVLVGVLVLVGGFYAIRNTEFVRSSETLNRFATLSIEEISKQGRRYVWPMAIAGFKERPILGWGQENFDQVFSKYYDPRMYAQEPWFDRAHNIVLDWLVAGGILGLLGYLSVFAAFLWLVWKNNTFTVTDKAILVALAAAYFFQNLFVFDNLVSYMYFFALIAFVHAMSVQEKPALTFTRVLDSQLMKAVMPVFAAALVVFVIYSWNTKPILANREIIRAIHPDVSKTPEDSLIHFEKAFSYNTFAEGEALEQMYSQLGKFASETVKPETRQAYAGLVFPKMDAYINRYPDNTRALLFAGSLRNRMGDFQNAAPYLLRAVETSPKKQGVLFELGFVHLSTSQFTEALAIFKRAYELAPEYEEARLLYGIAALYAKNPTLTKELFATIPESTLVADERIIAAYHGTGNTAEAVKILEKRLVASPNDVQLRFRVAAGYLSINQRTKAIQALQEAARLFPEAKAQADYYIKEIQAGRNP